MRGCLSNTERKAQGSSGLGGLSVLEPPQLAKKIRAARKRNGIFFMKKECSSSYLGNQPFLTINQNYTKNKHSNKYLVSFLLRLCKRHLSFLHQRLLNFITFFK